MSLRYGFEFGVLVVPVLGSVDGVVVVDGLFMLGLVALGSVGRPEAEEPGGGGGGRGLAGVFAVDELPVALSVPMVPVEPTEEPVLPTEEPVPPTEEPV